MADTPSDQSRSLPPPEDRPPRSDMAPNANPPMGTVSPSYEGVPPVASPADLPTGTAGVAGQYDNVGVGGAHVMYPADNPPPEMVAWAGWPAEWATPEWNSFGPKWMGGGTDIVWAAINLNATAISDMPTVVSKAGSLQASPSWLINPQPQLYTQWAEFVRQACWSYWAVGEVFIICTSRFQDSGYPRTFMILDPWLVNAEIKDGLRAYSVNGIDVTDEILHIRYSSWPGDARGHGPLEVAGERITAARVLMRYASDLASAGGVPWGILTSKMRMTKAESEKLKRQWVEAARSRLGAPAILDADLNLQITQTTPRDMTLTDLQKFAEARVAVLLGVPPYLLGLPSGADSLTYSNVNSIFDYWWRITLKPHGQYIMHALSEWALPGHVDLILNASAYTQPPALERAQYYQIMAALGAMSVDEIRAAESLSPAASHLSPIPQPQTVVT
jgi:HK97 family phage portal protein